jgi:hypothetical protein
MKSRKIILIAFLAITSVLGLAALQDNIFVESQIVQNQSVNVKEVSSEGKTITVDINDGVGLGMNG